MNETTFDRTFANRCGIAAQYTSNEKTINPTIIITPLALSDKITSFIIGNWPGAKKRLNNNTFAVPPIKKEAI